MTEFRTISSEDWKQAFKRAREEPNNIRQKIQAMSSNQIIVSIDCNKIDKSRIKVKASCRYLDLILIPTPNNKFGDTHLVRQDSSQQEREGGVRLPIIGNAREFVKDANPGGFLGEEEPI